MAIFNSYVSYVELPEGFLRVSSCSPHESMAIFRVQSQVAVVSRRAGEEDQLQHGRQAILIHRSPGDAGDAGAMDT